MRFLSFSHRHADKILDDNPNYREILNVIRSISDDELISTFEHPDTRSKKSISISLNKILDLKFVEKHWRRQSEIFSDPEYTSEGSDRHSYYRLDFAKEDISIEVGFNHREAASWNLLKPVLASELNYIDKAIQTKYGVIITATNELKEAGGFDSAVGSFEDYIKMMRTLNSILTVPVLIIGLRAPETFRIRVTQRGNTKIGSIERL